MIAHRLELDASRDDLRLQRRLTLAAAEWAASAKDRSFLASGARLEQLSSWAAETHLALNAEERDYLAASLAERDAQQIEEERLAKTIVDKLTMIGSDKGGLYLFDRDLEGLASAGEGK